VQLNFAIGRNLATPPRPPETADAEIQKNHDNHRRCDKGSMIGAMLPARPRLPQNRAKDQYGQQKKNARNLQPDFSANATEWLEKAAESASNAAGSLSCDAPAVSGIGWRRARLGVGCSRIGLLAIAHDRLAGEAASHADTNAQYTANGFRSHFDMMVAAPDLRSDLFKSNTGAICRMDICEVRYRNQSPLPAQFAALAAAGGKPLTSRLRELIQQLGEAIHESVIESEQIAGVVQDIRKHGFDVLLMLEATIGLNEVSKETGEADAAAEAAGGTFTKNDVNFLRSLRISIEGEDNDELTQGEDETQAG
jgi:hypothetical protein